MVNTQKNKQGFLLPIDADDGDKEGQYQKIESRTEVKADAVVYDVYDITSLERVVCCVA
jgi:hypothetical protein